jgi:hypothetical protein
LQTASQMSPSCTTGSTFIKGTVMALDSPCRILIVTEKIHPTLELLDAVRRRAHEGDVRFRLVVLNPAAAEVGLLHPERHRKAEEAERVLLAALPEVEKAAGHSVIGSVSIRHDPMDAIEATMLSEPVDELMLEVHAHPLSTWMHQDLPHRLIHFGLPTTLIGAVTSV